MYVFQIPWSIFLHAFICFFKNKRQDGVFADAKKKKNGSYVYKVQNESHSSDGKAFAFSTLLLCFYATVFLFN